MKHLTALICLASLLLSACGQRGPLYLPQGKPMKQTNAGLL